MLSTLFPTRAFSNTSLDIRKYTVTELNQILVWRSYLPEDTTNGELRQYVESGDYAFIRLPVNETNPTHLLYKNRVLLVFATTPNDPFQQDLLRIFWPPIFGGLGYTHIRYNPDGATENEKIELSLDNTFTNIKTFKDLIIAYGTGSLAISGEIGDGTLANVPNNLFGDDSADNTDDYAEMVNGFLYEGYKYDYIRPNDEPSKMLLRKDKDNYIVLHDKDTHTLKGENLIYIKPEDFVADSGNNTDRILIFDEDEGIKLSEKKGQDVVPESGISVIAYRGSSADDSEDILGINGNNLISNTGGYIVTNGPVVIKFTNLDPDLGDDLGIAKLDAGNSHFLTDTVEKAGVGRAAVSLTLYSNKTQTFPFDVTVRLMHWDDSQGIEKTLATEKLIYDRVEYKRLLLTTVLVSELNDRVYCTVSTSYGAGGIKIIAHDTDRFSTLIFTKFRRLPLMPPIP